MTRGLFAFKIHSGNDAGKLLPDLFFISEKALYEVKGSSLQLSFDIFR